MSYLIVPEHENGFMSIKVCKFNLAYHLKFSSGCRVKSFETCIVISLAYLNLWNLEGTTRLIMEITLMG